MCDREEMAAKLMSVAAELGSKRKRGLTDSDRVQSGDNHESRHAGKGEVEADFQAAGGSIVHGV